jgi:predicted alpha/beta superfamily hydrolase
MKRGLWISLLLCLGIAAPVQAKPDLTEKLGPTIADRGSAFYRFETLEMPSADGARHYRIWIGVPKRPAPRIGYPVIYLLDGNAAMGALNEQRLAELDEQGPPVLVAIGYATDLRFDVVARAYDYTPPMPGVEKVIDDLSRDRQGGGADQFLDLLEQRIKPAVAERAPIDRSHQTLWGHSYGGLLVLHTLFTRPQSFQTYASADPSLWWQKGFILGEEKAFNSRENRPKRLLLMHGEAPAGGGTPPPGVDDKVVQARREAQAAVPPDAIPQLAARLARLPGMQVGYRAFPGMDHGPLLPVSLDLALQLALGKTPAEVARHGQ